MDVRLKTFVALAGLLIQIGSYIGVLLDVFRDPFYLFLTLSAGVLTLLWISLVAWQRVEAVGQTLDSTGAPQRYSQERASRLQKIAVSIVFVIALGWLAFVFVSEGKRIFDPAFVSRPIYVGPQNAVFINDGNAERFFKQHDLNVHTSVQSTPVMNSREVHLEEIRSLAQDGAGYVFTVSKRPRLPWIQIDEIRAIVEKHWKKEGLPDIAFQRSVRCDTGVGSNMFIAELRPPAHQGSEQVCLAKCVFPEHAIISGTPPFLMNDIPRITDNSPFPIRLLLTATEPGLYQYRVEIVVSCLGRETRLDVVPPTLCVAEKRVSQGRVSEFPPEPKWITPAPLPKRQK